jgi:hypothetical protein
VVRIDSPHDQNADGHLDIVMDDAMRNFVWYYDVVSGQFKHETRLSHNFGKVVGGSGGMKSREGRWWGYAATLTTAGLTSLMSGHLASEQPSRKISTPFGV